jgi:protoporphyrinogen oxidase
MDNLHILGGGLSGLSTAYHSEGTSTLYEQKNYVGGTAASMNWEGFTFDYGPHVSFTKDDYIQELFAKTVNNNFLTKKVSNSNYYQGQWIRHPAICNLCDPPNNLNRDALISFLESKERSDVYLC